jgi:hypothetical protein
VTTAADSELLAWNEPGGRQTLAVRADWTPEESTAPENKKIMSFKFGQECTT